MSDNSRIEWTDATWNPVTGCAKVSPGCDNCYAERVTERFHGRGSFATVQLHPDRLDQPLRWRKPRRVFVNSMSDLFHADAPTAFLAEVFAVMALAEAHTFQVLTKRHARMRSVLNSKGFMETVQSYAVPLAGEYGINTTWAERCTDPRQWPLPNVWMGVSVEEQRWAVRVDALRETPAAVRFVSAEPLLGPLSLDLTGVGWVIVGGESGPGARPMHPDWARGLRDQCSDAGVPFFFKQWGEWAPKGRGIGIGQHAHGRQALVGPADDRGFRQVLERVGKKAAGRELDGRTWDEYPAGVR